MDLELVGLPIGLGEPAAGPAEDFLALLGPLVGEGLQMKIGVEVVAVGVGLAGLGLKLERQHLVGKPGDAGLDELDRILQRQSGVHQKLLRVAEIEPALGVVVAEPGVLGGHLRFVGGGDRRASADDGALKGQLMRERPLEPAVGAGNRRG